MILQYATYVPKDLTTELTHLNYAGAVVTEFESWMNRMRGQLLFYRVLLDDPVNQAIARSEIQGDVSDLYDGVDACIRSTGNALRSFAVESTRDDSAFTEWTILMRTPLQRETLGKIAIDTPRQALITELLEDGCRGPETIIREYADQIVTLGYAESTGDDRVKRFELEDGRLAEINYAPAGLASPFAHAAQQLTRRSPLENGQFSSHTWYSTNDSGRESHYLPLLDCIEGFEEDKSQPSRLKEATAMLTACMRDKGWRLAKSTGTRAPVCRGIKP